MKVSLPKGTRDFLPEEVVRRQYIFSIIERVFKTYAYVPIETPALENLSTLTGKYGEEGDRLLFKVLNNGDFLSKADEDALKQRDSDKLIPSIARRGLRYDLTVPFARYVVMHQNALPMPFKRYQIQPVWRADRPQKGRYQEFYQCDADVVGSDSLSYEAELVQIYDEVFHALGIRVEIRLNNRKILSGIAEAAGIPALFGEMTVAIDKLDKIGWDGVLDEMRKRGIPEDAAIRVRDLLGANDLDQLGHALENSEAGSDGVREVRALQEYIRDYKFQNQVAFDPTLARGLSYYTGCIFEVIALDVEMGSLGGGGRYNDLTGIFGMPGIPGVGISFGAERIYDVLQATQGFPGQLHAGPKVLFIAFDPESHQMAFRWLSAVRKAGIAADLYPEPRKLRKQMKYANAIDVPFVALIGEEEMRKEVATLKEMGSGKQEPVTLSALIDALS